MANKLYEKIQHQLNEWDKEFAVSSLTNIITHNLRTVLEIICLITLEII